MKAIDLHKSNILFILLSIVMLNSCRDSRIYVYKGEEKNKPLDMVYVYKPTNGYIKTPAQAAKIAESVVINIYGADEIENQKPFIVKKWKDVWIVKGSFPENTELKGGVFEVRISADDGRILGVSHGE